MSNLTLQVLAAWRSDLVEQYARKKRNDLQPSLFDTEVQPNLDGLGPGRWITIGAEPDGNGKKTGGHPVFVGTDGKMKTGNFAGKSMVEAFGGEKPKDNQESKMPDSHRVKNGRGGGSRFKGVVTVGDIRARLRDGESLHFAKYGGGDQWEVRGKVRSGASRGIIATFEPEKSNDGQAKDDGAQPLGKPATRPSQKPIKPQDPTRTVAEAADIIRTTGQELQRLLSEKRNENPYATMHDEYDEAYAKSQHLIQDNDHNDVRHTHHNLPTHLSAVP